MTKHQFQKKYNDGAVPLVVILVLAITSAMAVGGGYFLNIAGQKGLLTSNISQMVKDAETKSGYLDEERVENSFFDKKVAGTVLLPNGSFSAYEVISGEVTENGNQFVNKARISFLSGDQALDYFNDGNIAAFYLKDGTRITAQIMDRMIANLVLDDKTSFAIKILQGKVEAERLIGDFVGQTYDNGFVIAGTVDKNGKITNAVVKTGAQKKTEVESTVAKNAVSLFRSASEVTANIDVLGISDYQPVGFNKPIFDKNTGTWAFVGETSDGAILASPTQGVVNYIQSIAQSITSGESVYQQAVDKVIQGITDLKSNSSELKVTTLDNIATLSVDLSGITAVGVSDSSINESDLVSSNDPAGGQCLTYNSSTGGFTWGSCGGSGGSGTVTGVTAGNGLTGGGTSGSLSLAISPATGGGLETDSNGVSLLTTCSSNEILKWDGSSWACATDAGGGGGGITALQVDDTTAVSSATTIDFLGTDFDLTNSPLGEGNLAIDYTNSKITRSNQGESITGAWTFVTAPVISTISNTGTITLPTSTDTLVGRNTNDTLINKTISATGNTISGLSVTNFASANISQWTNNSNYLTGNQTITLSGDVSGSGTTSISTTIGSGVISLSKMANLAANSIIGNNTGSTATPVALTGSQVKTLLGISTSDISGLGTIATQSASNIYLTGGQISGVTIAGTASGLTISGASNTLSNISNSSLSNSSVTINSSGILSGGGSVSLGGTLNLSATEADTFSSVTGRGASTATALTLSSAIPITFSGTNPTITFSGGNTIFDLTGATTRILNILNSTTSQVANVIVDGTISASNFSGTSSGTNTGDQTITLTSDVTGSGTGSFAATIASGAVTLGKMANLAANSIIGNNTGSSTTPIALTGSQVKTLLGISTSDVSGLGTIATQSASNVFITGGQLSGLVSINGATISGGSISGGSLSAVAVNGVTTGNIILSTGSYSDPTWVTSLSPTKVLPDQTGNNGKVLGTNGTTLSWVTNSSGVAWGAITGTLSSQTDLNTALSGKLGTSLTNANIFVGNVSNVATGVAMSGDVTMDNTGLTTIGSGKVSLGKMANLAANSIIGNNTGSAAVPTALTASQAKTLLSISTSDVSGLGTIATQSASNIFVTGGQIVGGAINGVTIGAVTPSSGVFTTLSANNFSGTSSGTNTGDQTITLQGDVTGTGTGAFTATIASNSVALGTDTTGNYVSGATSNGGLSLTGTEGATLGIILPAATDALSVTTSSGSGLELLSTGLSLLQGCSDGQLLKWNETTDTWGCASDSTGGAGTLAIQEGGVPVLSAASTVNFGSSDFAVTDQGSNVAGITLDYTNSKITRTDQIQSILGAWTFSDLTISDTNIPLSGVSLTFDFNNALDRTLSITNSSTGLASLSVEGTIGASNFSGTSSGTNTGDQTIILTSDVTGTGTGSFATTIASGAVTLSKMANLAANSIIGNNTGSSATPIALTASQVKTLLGISTSDISGLGTIATQSASNIFITGGSLSGLTSVGATTFMGALTGNASTATSLATSRTIAGTSFDGSANISLANKFIVQGISDSGLSGAQFLGALGTGIVKNTATTGVLSIAVAGDFPTLNQNTTGTAANITGVLGATSFPAMTGDVTNTQGSLTTAIANGAVTLGKMANLAANSIIGNNTGSSTTPIALTTSQVKTLLGISTSDVSGLGTIATQSASNIFITGGQVSGVTIGGTATGLSISGSTNTLSNIGNSSLTNSSVTINTSGILSGGGSISLGETLNLSATEADTLLSVTGRGATTSNGITLSSASPLIFSSSVPVLTLGTGDAAGVLTIKDSNATPNALLTLADAGTTGNLSVTGTLSGSNFSGNSSGTNTGDQTISLTSDVTGSGTGSFAVTIANGAVTLGKMANLAANSIIGNNTGSPATPIALTAAQVKTLLSISTSDVSGLGTIATQSASNIFITGGQISGLISVNGTTLSGGSLSSTAVNGVTTGNIVVTSGSYTDPSWITSLAPSKVLPDQTGQNGKVLSTNGSTLSWITNSSGVAWGAITGTLSDQADLNTALSGKLGTALTSANIFVGNGSGVATGVTVIGDVTIDNTGATTIGSGKVSLSKMANLAANSIIGNNTGSSATPIALTAAQVKTLLSISTTDISGLGTIATQSASNVFITGGQIIGGIINGATIGAVTPASGVFTTLSANNFSGTSSGTNTGDQTITLTGDVTGSGTGSFTTTIAGNSVALGTDTTGDYIATLTSGNGISAAAAGEGSTPTISLAALTADWNQTGAFDIVLGNTSSELKMLESGVTPTLYGILDVGDLSTSDSTFTFSGSSGTVITSSNAADQLSAWDQTSSDDLTTGNYSTTLDSIYVNVGESPTGGDISGSFSGGLTVAANSVALGTDTTGNYIASATSNGGLTVTGTEGGSLGIALPVATDALSVTTSSGSGLELLASGVTLLQGCSDGQLLKWNETTDTWGCSTDNTGAGGGVSTIKEGGTNIVTSAITLNYAAADFIITDETAGVAGIAIDYANSKITRSNQMETITKAWSFSNTGQSALGRSLLTIDQYENQDIFTASASGTPKFVITQFGTVGIGTATPDPGVSMHIYKNDDNNIWLGTEEGFIADIIYKVGGLSAAELEFDTTQDTFEIGTNGLYDLFFKTNGSEKMRIESDGDVVIGKNFVPADARLEVLAGTGDQLRLTQTEDVNYATFAVNGSTLTINAGGTVSIQDALTAAGAISAPTSTNTINGLVINAGALSGATTLGLSGAITGATSTNTINGIIINSGAVSGVSTLGLSGAITGPTATNTINGMIINSGAVSGVTTLSASSTVTIGSGGNTYTFNPSAAPALAGTARPDRREELVPEFPGAVLTGSGTGTMTSDFCAASAGVGGLTATNTTVCNTSGDTHNYYNWTTSQGTAQAYSIYVKWRVPDNFSAWDTSNSIQAYAKRSDATNGHVSIKVYDTANALNNAGGTEVAGAANTWVQNGINISGGTWTQGNYMTIQIDVTAAATGGITNLGEISLNYFTSN